ncbi:MAG TPA: 50S ribosomal protein L11 methyltransferase, partial [Rhodothermia bacterium]
MSTETDSATVELLIDVDPSAQDRLVAELDRLGFEAYLQDDEEFRAYIPSSRWSAALDTQVRGLLSMIGLPPAIRITRIPPQNWNQQWEDTIEPVAVGIFIVTPSWHRDQSRELGLIPIEIDPKMSFGTGYHATTRLMLHMLPSVVHGGERVLDAGTGTGILAIAAARLGA